VCVVGGRAAASNSLRTDAIKYFEDEHSEKYVAGEEVHGAESRE